MWATTPRGNGGCARDAPERVGMPPLSSMDGRGLLSDLEDLGGDALVVLGTPVCGACRLARRLLTELTEAEVGGPGLRVVDVDAQHAMGLVEDWEIHHLPGLVLVRAGDPWAKLQTQLTPVALSAAIRRARRGPPDGDL